MARGAIIYGIHGAFMFGALFVLRKTSRIAVTANLVAAVAISALANAALMKTGFPVSVLMWLAMIPLCGNLVMDRKYVLTWTVVALIVAGALYTVALTGSSLAPAQELNPERLLTLEFLSLAVLFGFMLYLSSPISSSTDDLAQERDQLEGDLLHAQRLDGVGQLAGTIGHDFGNVAMVLEGSAQLLRLRLPKQDRCQELVEEMLRACENAHALAHQLRVLSRKNNESPETLSVNELVSNNTGLVKRFVGDTVKVEHQLTEKPRLVHVDAKQLDQVLFNLCINARDAMPSGGTLRIETENADLEPTQRKQLGLTTASCVVMSIRDTGTGIAPELAKRIFEPFFTTKGEDKGTGLGLSSCQNIVKRWGGCIAVESVQGVGSCFRVYLPAQAQIDQAAPVPSPIHAYVAGSSRPDSLPSYGAIPAVGSSALSRVVE